jgi:hypothetical protein
LVAEALTAFSHLPTENRRRYCIDTERGLDDSKKKSKVGHSIERMVTTLAKLDVPLEVDMK